MGVKSTPNFQICKYILGLLFVAVSSKMHVEIKCAKFIWNWVLIRHPKFVLRTLQKSTSPKEKIPCLNLWIPFIYLLLLATHNISTTTYFNLQICENEGGRGLQQDNLHWLTSQTLAAFSLTLVSCIYVCVVLAVVTIVNIAIAIAIAPTFIFCD